MAQKEQLGYRIDVKGARGLIPMDPNGQSDPYCLVGLADNETLEFIDQSKVVRSKTHFVTLTPVWKQFYLIATSTEFKVRIEIWDKDQDFEDDFEGMAIVDLNTLEGTKQESWLPLIGRTPDEKVTGDVNIQIIKGPLSELESIRSSAGVVPPAAPREDESAALKRLNADLKTKSGRLDLANEKNAVLDQTVVKMKQQIEQLQGEITKKNNELHNQETELTKAKGDITELQKALHDKQNVSLSIKEWNDKAREMNKLQDDLKAKFQRHQVKSKSNGKEAQATSSDEGPNIQKIMDQFTEYASLIESLEVDLKSKTEQLEEKEQRLAQAVNSIEKLQSENSTKLEEREQQIRQSSQSIAKLQEDLTIKIGEQEQELNRAAEAIAKLQEELAVSLEEEQQLKDTIIKLQEDNSAAMSAKEQEITTATETISKLRTDFEVLLKKKEEELSEVQYNVTLLRQEHARKLEEKEQTITRLQADLEFKHGEGDQRTEQFNHEVQLRIEFENKLRESEKERSKAEHELTEAHSTLNLMQEEMKTKTEEIEHKGRLELSIAKQLNDATHVIAELQAELSEMSERFHKEKLRVELKDEVLTRSGELAQLHAIKTELEKRSETPTEEDKQIIEQLRRELLEKSQKLDEVLEEGQKEKAERAELEERYKQLQAEKAALEGKLSLQTSQSSLQNGPPRFFRTSSTLSQQNLPANPQINGSTTSAPMLDSNGQAQPNEQSANAARPVFFRTSSSLLSIPPSASTRTPSPTADDADSDDVIVAKPVRKPQQEEQVVQAGAATFASREFDGPSSSRGSSSVVVTHRQEIEVWGSVELKNSARLPSLPRSQDVVQAKAETQTKKKRFCWIPLDN